MKRKVAIVTSTRADWGLLSPIARGLSARDDVAVTVVATNMHLDPSLGHTLDEIRADGFAEPVIADMPVGCSTPVEAAAAMGKCLGSTAVALADIGPDLLVILGDRFEMLAVASAATLLRIPIVHIAGGEISEGAFDDSVRHAITKLSSLHLTATEPYRRRVIQMGEAPGRVINTGAIGVYNNFHTALMTRDELSRSLGICIGDNCVLVTLHPATLDSEPPRVRAEALACALDRFPELQVLWTYPNNDPGGREIIEVIDAYAAAHPRRVTVVPSLGRVRYLSALRCVKAVIGNSSSGIVEVPSAGIPTVDIGIRQRGRIAADSVIHCEATADAITAAVARALHTDASATVNPYFRPDTLSRIVDAIALTPVEGLIPKHFHDL